MPEGSLSQPSASLLGIPDELLLAIVTLLSFHDQINLVRCCTKLREFLLQTPSLQKSRYGRILEPSVGEPYWWYSCTVDTHALLHTLLGDPTTKLFVSLDGRTITRYLYGGYLTGKDQEITTFKFVGNSLPYIVTDITDWPFLDEPFLSPFTASDMKDFSYVLFSWRIVPRNSRQDDHPLVKIYESITFKDLRSARTVAAEMWSIRELIGSIVRFLKEMLPAAGLLEDPADDSAIVLTRHRVRQSVDRYHLRAVYYQSLSSLDK